MPELAEEGVPSLTLWGDIIRAGAIALLAIPAALAMRQAVSTGRRHTWIILLAPFLTPSLVVGYGYSNFALSLVHHSVANRLWYAALVLLRLAPAACVVLHFVPRALSPEAVHCRRLSHGGAGLLFRLQAGCGAGPALAGTLVFLLAFSEFEIASLLNLSTWPVRLFDGHVGGLPLSRSLGLALTPFAVQTLILLLALILFTRQKWNNAQPAAPLPRRLSRRARVSGWSFILAANLFVLVLPAWAILRGAATGWQVTLANFALGGEILTSLAYGTGAGLAAYLLVPRRWWQALAASLPGLVTPMVLALVIGASLQAFVLTAFRDTPLPLALALTLLLLPLATLLRNILRRDGMRMATHAARLLHDHRGRRLIWRLHTRRHVWAIFLLVCWGYLDLTAAAILAPIGTTPVSVRLYNLMHYGQTAALSTMVTAAFVAPLIAVGLVLVSHRLWMRF